MLPVIRIGPAALPVAPLALMLGVWLGAWLAERQARRQGRDSDAIASLILVALVGGLLGARLGYVLRHLGAYLADPPGLISPNPATLDGAVGLAVAGATALWYGRRRALPFWATLDLLTPGFAMLMVALGVAHLASGDAFGAPTILPWSISLWDAQRHPSQVYEIASALIVLGMWRLECSTCGVEGLRFLVCCGLSAAARIFLEAFRGDSVIVMEGLRVAQLWALLLLGLCLWAIGWRAAGREQQTRSAQPAGQ